MTAIALALAPSLAIMWYIYAKDEFDKEPISLLVFSFLLGIFSVIPALIGGNIGEYLGYGLIGGDVFAVFIHAFIVVAFSEEFAKFLFLAVFLFPQRAFNEPYDGIIYAVMIGMGFATFENLVYVLQGGIEVAILRMFTAVPAHAAFGVIMGYYVGMAKFDRSRRFILLFAGLFWAVLAHGAYDFFLMLQNMPALACITIGVLIFSISMGLKSIKIHQEQSPFNPDNFLPEDSEEHRSNFDNYT